MRLKAKVVGCELSRRSRTVAKELLDLQSSEIVIPIHSLFSQAKQAADAGDIEETHGNTSSYCQN